jgi:hypothetical protein
MSDRVQYPQVNFAEEVTNDSASADLVSNPGETMYVYLERAVISVFQAASGGGGYVRLQDTDGNNIHTINADGVKDVTLDFGTEGIRLGPNVGLQLITAGAQSKQASASISGSGHLSFR